METGVFQDFPNRECPERVTIAEMEYRSGYPRVLCIGESLSGELKLKWILTSVIPRLIMQIVPW